MPLVELLCKRCNNTFTAFVTTNPPRFCDSCKIQNKSSSNERWRILNPQKAREAFHKWYAENMQAPPEVDVTCKGCGKIFRAKSKRKKKCDWCIEMSRRERVKVWKEMNPDKVAEQKRRWRSRKTSGAARRIFREGPGDGKSGS